MIKALTLAEIKQASELVLDCYDHGQMPFQSAVQDQSFHAFMKPELLIFQQKSKKVQFYGSFVENKLVGVAMLRKNHLSLLFVSRETQRQGIGRNLLEYLIVLLQEQKFSFIDVLASANAVGFYQQCGFSIVENQEPQDGKTRMEYWFQPFFLRPHHGLCIKNFVGKGYSEEFVEQMTTICDHFKQHPMQPVQLIVSEDVLCKHCPHHQNGCVSGQKVQAMDQMVLEFLNISENTVLDWQTLQQKVKQQIIQPTSSVCQSCQWSDTCVAVAAKNGEIW